MISLPEPLEWLGLQVYTPQPVLGGAEDWACGFKRAREAVYLSLFLVKNKSFKARHWGHMPLIPAVRRQRQADLWEFEASLIYRVCSRTDWATQRNPVFKKN